MTEVSTIELVKNYRPSVKLPGGATKSHRDYYDFVINGFPLSDLAKKRDMVSCLWIPVNKWTIEAAQRLLLEIPADFPENRRSLYGCAECGDLGCGAISLVIESEDTMIVWRDFALQTNYEDVLHQLPDFDELGELRFNKTEYSDLLHSIIKSSE